MSVDPRVMAGGGKSNVSSKSKINVGEKVHGSLNFIGEIFTALTTVNRFRIASILVFFVGVYTTSIVLKHGTGGLPVTEVGTFIGQFYGDAFVGAILVEFIFTTLTSPIITGKGRHPISIFFLFVNMGINSIVTLPIAKGLIGSGAWYNINQAISVFTGVVASLWGGSGIDIGNGDVVVYTLMLIMAFSLAIGSEVLWHMGAKKG